MNLQLLAFLGWPEIIGILVVVLVLFGAKKVPELARGLGQGIKEFKKATREVQDDLQRAIEEEPPVEPVQRVAEKKSAGAPAEPVAASASAPASSTPSHSA